MFVDGDTTTRGPCPDLVAGMRTPRRTASCRKAWWWPGTDSRLGGHLHERADTACFTVGSVPPMWKPTGWRALSDSLFIPCVCTHQTTPRSRRACAVTPDALHSFASHTNWPSWIVERKTRSSWQFREQRRFPSICRTRCTAQSGCGQLCIKTAMHSGPAEASVVRLQRALEPIRAVTISSRQVHTLQIRRETA